jgi:hypothetical protein
MDRTRNSDEDTRNVYRTLVGKPHESMTLGRSRRRGKNNEDGSEEDGNDI